MKITDIQTHHPAGLLRILTDAGVEGWCPGVSEEKARQVRAFYRDVLLGRDPLNRERFWGEMVRIARLHHLPPPAWGCVDVALWDLGGKATDLPVYRLIGGFREQVPACLSGGDVTRAEGFAAEALRAREEKFPAYKACGSLGAEGARALRAAVGPDFHLMHDGGGRYGDAEALRVGRAVEALDYRWFEDPLRDPSPMRLKRLADALDTPVMAGGAPAGDLRAISQLLAMQAVDRVRVRLPRDGGITGQMKVARLAEGFGLDVHGGNPHVILAIPNDPLFEAVPRKIPPLRADERLTPQGRAVLEEGCMTIVSGAHPAGEPDWDRMGREALSVV